MRFLGRKTAIEALHDTIELWDAAAAFPHSGEVISVQEPMGTALIRDDRLHQVWGVARKHVTPATWAVIAMGAHVDFQANGYGSVIDAKRHA